MSLIQVPLKLFSHAKPCFHKYLFQYKIVDRSFTLATQHLIHSRLLSLLHTMNDNESSVSLTPTLPPLDYSDIAFYTLFL